MTREINNIAIVGSGNVARYMGHLFSQNAFTVSKVISRNAVSGQALADALGTSFSSEFLIASGTDLVVLCVNDDEVRNVSQSLKPGDYAVCHCAGSLSINLLDKHKFYGVMYPLQSIHKDTDVASTEVPFLIETNVGDLQQQLEKVLDKCHKSYYEVNSEQRLGYHLAAVFANNFSNAMMMAAEGITNEFKLDFKLLQPLIEQTFKHIENHHPEQVQTGPAKRNDRVTMERHLALLSANPGMKVLYEAVSAYIGEKFKK